MICVFTNNDFRSQNIILRDEENSVLFGPFHLLNHIFPENSSWRRQMLDVKQQEPSHIAGKMQSGEAPLRKQFGGILQNQT